MKMNKVKRFLQLNETVYIRTLPSMYMNHILLVNTNSHVFPLQGIYKKNCSFFSKMNYKIS